MCVLEQMQIATFSHINFWIRCVFMVSVEIGWTKIHARLTFFVMFNIVYFLFIDVLHFFGKYHKFFFNVLCVLSLFL